MTDTENQTVAAFAYIANLIEGSTDLPPSDVTESDLEVVDLIEGEDATSAFDGTVDPSSDRNAALPSDNLRSWGFDVDEMNRTYALTIWGSKAVVVREQRAGKFTDRFQILHLEALHKWFANRFTEVTTIDGRTKVLTWAKAWETHSRRRQYTGVEFFPNPDGKSGTSGFLNLWQGFDIKPSDAGDCSIFKDHLFTNVCGGDRELFKYVFGWMAHIIQKPRERLGVAIVLRGRKGTGKSKLGEVLGSLFSPHYFQVDDARYVTGQFNAHMASCLLLQADEAVWAGDKAAEGRLKGLITGESHMVEAKKVDSIRMPNYMRILMTSNEGWVVPASADERRFCVLDVGNRNEKDNSYFAAMDTQLDSGGRERLLHELSNFDLSQIDLRRIPRTKALLDQQVQSFDSISDFWWNRLSEGCLLPGDSDWRDRVSSSELHTEYIKASSQLGIGRKRSPAEFGARMFKLIPGLRKVRVSVEVAAGVGGRAWAYDMPSLTECRTAFEQTLGQSIDWPVSAPGEGERAEKVDSDDDIPF